MKPPPGKYIVGVAVVVVVGVVIAALAALGPPSRARARRMDLKRVEELSTIASAVSHYRNQHEKLPTDLPELSRGSGPGLPTRDPATQEPYEYRVLGDTKYELCASFQEESPLGAPPFGDSWSHRAGRQCFQLETRGASR